MKKYFLYPLILLTLTQMRAFAQESHSRWSIGLTGGPAFPTGRFAHYNEGVPYNGGVTMASAHTGVDLELSGAYRFSREFSAVLAINGQENHGGPISSDEINPGGPANPPVYPVYTYPGGKWRLARLLTGGLYTHPLEKKNRIALRIRLLGGIQKTQATDYEYFPPLELFPGPLRIVKTGFNKSPAFPWTFAYEADAGIQWTLTRRLSLLLETGYTGAHPGQVLPYSNEKATFPTGTVHIRTGLTYFFPYSKKISVAP